MNNLNWDELRYFLAVAEHGSLSAAARHLDSKQPTVGRHIDALETVLGTRLFQRTPMGLHLTQEGTLLLELARRVQSAVLGVERLVGGQPMGPGGVVRLALPEGLCNEVVVPRLEGFYQAYPGIRLILNVSSRTANLTRGEADIAIRLFRPEEPDLVVRQLGRLEMVLAAGRDYLQRHEFPTDETQLKPHRVIAYGDELEGQPENQWLLKRVDPERIILKSDSTTARRRATEDGLGISIQPRFTIAGAGTLVPLLEQAEIPGYEVWLVCHRDLRDIYRVRVVLDFVSSLFE